MSSSCNIKYSFAQNRLTIDHYFSVNIVSKLESPSIKIYVIYWPIILSTGFEKTYHWVHENIY